MLWNRIRQVIYAALTVIGFVWTNYYLVQFTIATKGELTPANFLDFDREQREKVGFDQSAIANLT